ncbi:hypothetical protein CSE45_2691 [Citreicella sp. SE45]|nr:hypothetical protein CSE45_2691 [Citreicella sp. SE45]
MQPDVGSLCTRCNSRTGSAHFLYLTHWFRSGLPQLLHALTA